MSKNLRITNSKFIDQTSRISFKFDGKTLYGFKGDTLASALLANDIHLVGRSFKYHRPRGIMACGSEEPMIFLLFLFLSTIYQVLRGILLYS